MRGRERSSSIFHLSSPRCCLLLLLPLRRRLYLRQLHEDGSNFGPIGRSSWTDRSEMPKILLISHFVFTRVFIASILAPQNSHLLPSELGSRCWRLSLVMIKRVVRPYFVAAWLYQPLPIWNSFLLIGRP